MKALIRVEYVWLCDKRKCPGQTKKSFIMGAGTVIPRPLVPEGWNEINGKLYCDKHEIRVNVDGKLTTDCTMYRRTD